MRNYISIRSKRISWLTGVDISLLLEEEQWSRLIVPRDRLVCLQETNYSTPLAVGGGLMITCLNYHYQLSTKEHGRLLPKTFLAGYSIHWEEDWE
jgi:hypothetical protein